MGNYLYNGVELPDINTVWTDKETLPFAAVVLNTTDNSYQLIITALPLYYYEGGCLVSEAMAAIVGVVDGTAWNAQSVTISPANWTGYQFVWSSYDIENYSFATGSSDGTLYLAASEPIPVESPKTVPKCDLKSLIIGLILELSRPQRPLNTVVLYYYGSHLMPGLPEWDKAAYPYAVIIPLGAVRVLLCKSHPFTAVGGKLYLAETTAAIAATVRGRVWEFTGEPGQYAPGAWDTSVEAVIWSNYDIQDESGAVVVGATEPVKLGGKREPVAYLYNGVRLPKLPKLAYPYAVIEYADVDSLVSGGRLARLICSSEPIQFMYTALYQVCYQVSGDVQYFGFANDDAVWEWSFSMEEPYPPLNEWVNIGEEHFEEPANISEKVAAANLIWANHDVNYSVDTSMGTPGATKHAASDPVPVYE